MLLGELLISKKLITQEQLDAALEEQKETGDFLGKILLKRRSLKEHDLVRALSEQFGIPLLSLKPTDIDWNVALKFTTPLIVEHQCFPYKKDVMGVWVAVVNPLDVQAVSKIEDLVKPERVRTVLVTTVEMAEILKTYKEKISGNIKKLLGGG